MYNETLLIYVCLLLNNSPVLFFTQLMFLLILTLLHTPLSMTNYLNYSNWMTILLIWIILICLIINNNYSIKFNKINLMIILITLLTFFNTNSPLLIYFTFEGSILPILMFMLWKSKSSDRFLSLMNMFLFMIIFSIPSILFLNQINNYNLSFNSYSMILLLMIMVKMPIFMFHIWLPKAHGDSPVYGSMILASIMLKMSGYLYLIFKPLLTNYLFNNLKLYLINLFITITLFLSLYTLIQLDIKILIALSSIVHMTMSFITMLISNNLSDLGIFLMMLAHGLTSSALFFSHNIFYENLHSRTIFILKNLKLNFKSMILIWFIICTSNMGLPLTINMMSEILIILNISLNINMMMLMMFIITILCTSIYSIFMFTFMMNYKTYLFNSFNNYINNKNFLINFSHIIPLFLFILKMSIF
uniref:NADH dehydrogenase subunit 4 n=1 Tax=Sclerodermus sichuanensis TaxID=592144 RepID=UPI002113E65A|nr:NADH dehydrogenase subunit 4 [Sclerodermus sichuanensis]UTN43177.1 NADH dehydrogenase subunit 4 [Sclerodermus sichuanensis]